MFGSVVGFSARLLKLGRRSLASPSRALMPVVGSGWLLCSGFFSPFSPGCSCPGSCIAFEMWRSRAGRSLAAGLLPCRGRARRLRAARRVRRCAAEELVVRRADSLSVLARSSILTFEGSVFWRCGCGGWWREGGGVHARSVCWSAVAGYSGWVVEADLADGDRVGEDELDDPVDQTGGDRSARGASRCYRDVNLTVLCPGHFDERGDIAAAAVAPADQDTPAVGGRADDGRGPSRSKG